MAQTGRRPFGRTPSGEPVELLTLDNGILSCGIITYGAVLQSLFVPDKNGLPVDVVLGCDSLEGYISHNDYMGAIVGRYANRIARGKFTLHDQAYTLAVNNGANHSHGGIVGFSHRVWTVEDLTETQAVLALDSPDGEEGYPGHLQVKVFYTLEDRVLSIRYEAETDRDTPCNLTSHPYFNLAGHDSGSVLEQVVSINAQHYTPADETGVPLGRLDPVQDTPMDLRTPISIGTHIDDSFVQLKQSGGYDHNYVVDGECGVLRPAASAASLQTGISMTIETTYPGMQLYTANFLEEKRPGKNGVTYGPRQAFCLEAEYFPDSPNHEAFPSAILKAGERYEHITRLVFG